MKTISQAEFYSNPSLFLLLWLRYAMFEQLCFTIAYCCSAFVSASLREAPGMFARRSQEHTFSLHHLHLHLCAVFPLPPGSDAFSGRIPHTHGCTLQGTSTFHFPHCDCCRLRVAVNGEEPHVLDAILWMGGAAHVLD